MGQCKVIWSKNHPWVEEGKGLEPSPAPLSGPALQWDVLHHGSAELSKQLIKPQCCGWEPGRALQTTKALDDSRVGTQEAELTSSLTQAKGLHPLTVIMAPVICLWLKSVFQRRALIDKKTSREKEIYYLPRKFVPMANHPSCQNMLSLAPLVVTGPNSSPTSCCCED